MNHRLDDRPNDRGSGRVDGARTAAAAPRRQLALCADDFGLDAATSAVIVELARQGRLSALSCLVNAHGWAASVALLARLPPATTCGLHFNLTEGTPASDALRAVWPRLPALPRLIAAAHLRRLPRAALAAELDAQWRVFVDTSGRQPDFVDGHQHVHHLPGVRELVLAAARRDGVAVRSTGRVAGPGFALKRWLIENTGGRALRRALQAAGLPHNRLLLGVYDFHDPDYRRLMQRWLAACPADGALLFCHPGAVAAPGSLDSSSEAADPIAAAREREARYLGSRDFLEDLAAAGVSVAAGWSGRSSAG